MTDQQLDQLCRILRALTDPTRLRIIGLLQAQGELSVSAICRRLQLDQARVSTKLRTMARLKLVKARREGRWVYYAVVDPVALELVLRRQLP